MPVYFNEKTKKYYCSFYYTEWQGIRRKKKKEGFTLSRDAKAYEQEFLNKAAGDCTMSFNALCDYYLADCAKRQKPTTTASKKYIFKNQFRPVFGDMPLTEITAVKIRQWQNDMLNSPEKYSPTYLHMLNNVLSALFNYAVKYYGLSGNPVKLAGKIGELRAHRMDFWTVDEFYKFIACIDEPLYKTAFNVLYFTGCRAGELLALSVGDYSPENKTLSISKNLATIGGKEYITTPKTKKSRRVISLPDKLCKMLDDYINSMYEPSAGERLFPSLNKFNLRRQLNNGVKKAGVKRIRLHDFRHSHASLLIELNFPPLAISERLGHEDIKTTLQIYAHLYPNKGSELADKLNSFIK